MPLKQQSTSAHDDRPPSQEGHSTITPTKALGKVLHFLKQYKQAAKQGHVKSQYKLALMYDEGDGARKNYAKAFRWYEEAAKRKCVSSQHALAIMYYLGEGVKRNYERAFFWFRAAAKSGYAPSQNALGDMHFGRDRILEEYCADLQQSEDQSTEAIHLAQTDFGWVRWKNLNLSDSYKDAVFWYKKAADQNDNDAYYSLGYMHSKGLGGLEKNDSKAFNCYELAAFHEHLDACVMLGHCYYRGTGVERNLEEALLYFKKAAKEGVRSAQRVLGQIYANDPDLASESATAAYWYGCAADQGDKIAQNLLGDMHLEGEDIFQSYDEALKFYKLSANQDYAPAQNNLGYMYDEGLGLREDKSSALYYYKLSAEQGYVSAQENLGYLYYSFRYYDEALLWFRKAAKQSSIVGEIGVRKIYVDRLGTPKDEALFKIFLQQAVIKRDFIAQDFLNDRDLLKAVFTIFQQDSFSCYIKSGYFRTLNHPDIKAIDFSDENLSDAQNLTYLFQSIKARNPQVKDPNYAPRIHGVEFIHVCQQCLRGLNVLRVVLLVSKALMLTQRYAFTEEGENVKSHDLPLLPSELVVNIVAFASGLSTRFISAVLKNQAMRFSTKSDADFKAPISQVSLSEHSWSNVPIYPVNRSKGKEPAEDEIEEVKNEWVVGRAPFLPVCMQSSSYAKASTRPKFRLGNDTSGKFDPAKYCKEKEKMKCEEEVAVKDIGSRGVIAKTLNQVHQGTGKTFLTLLCERAFYTSSQVSTSSRSER